MRLVGHVAGMRETKGAYWVGWEYLRERDHWENRGVYGRIILKWIFRKWNVGDGLD